MCTRYVPPEELEIERFWEIKGSRNPGNWGKIIWPREFGPFVTAADEIQAGVWGLIPPWSKSIVPKSHDGKLLSTFNARAERMATAPTYRNAWAKSQRCLIPATWWGEPCWETGKAVQWGFWRADGDPWALAGLWDAWRPNEGAEVLSYTMVTQNADKHPLLGRMHRLGDEKRAVVPIPREDWDTWLNGTPEQAQQLIRLPATELIRGEPLPASKP